jgi:hypothetical protein
VEAQWVFDPAVAMYGPLVQNIVAPALAVEQDVGNVVSLLMRDVGSVVDLRKTRTDAEMPDTPPPPSAAAAALQRHKMKLIGALVSRANADVAAKNVLRREENLRRERIDAHQREFGLGFTYELDDDGVHFRALEVTSEPPPAATVAVTPQIAPKSILKPARIVNRPVEKGAKSERTVPFRDYTVAPRPAGRPMPRVGADLTSCDYTRVRHLMDNSPAARRARVAKMRLDAAKLASVPFEITVASVHATPEPDVSTPDSRPRHFFADWLVKGVAGRVRISLDSGSDVSTVEEGHLSAAMRTAMVSLPVGLAACSFDGSSADMSNFLGVVSLSLQLGAFTTTTDFYVVKRGMAPFVLSKFVQAEMGAVMDYSTWRYHAAERKRVSKETFSVVIAADVAVCGPTTRMVLARLPSVLA